MARLDDMLAANRAFLVGPRPRTAWAPPRRNVAIVTSMDARLVSLLEAALGVDRGDVVEIKVASLTVPAGAKLDGEMVRSVVSGIYLLGVREVMVIGALRSGMESIDGRAVVAAMRAQGVDPSRLGAFRDEAEAGLVRWIGQHDDAHTAAAECAARIRAHPFIPGSVPVHALVIDPDTGALEVVERDEGRRR